MDRNKEKLNSSCIKIFKLLSLLYADEADYRSVISIFKDEVDEQTTNNLQVILNKNLNTLKVFGIKVKKENHRYRLESSFYTMDFTLEDLKSIAILADSIKNFPDIDCKHNLQNLINDLKNRMDNDSRSLLENISSNYDFGFYYSDVRDQIEKCKEICGANQQCEVTYLKNEKQIKCRCNPKDIIYGSRTAYLEVFDVNKNVKEEIPLNSILKLEQLHQMTGQTEKPTTVVFKVKNRLAKSYKLKDGEYEYGIDDEGNKIIVNKNEPFEKLISRLMRYSVNCEVISPKTLRAEILGRINSTLGNYE